MNDRRLFLLLFLLATVVYVIGMLVPVMDVDAAQYAAISREMLRNHSYLEVFNRGQDYLDKPPLLFWLSVVSFKVFGVSTFSYKLPSVLGTLLGVYSCYRLGNFMYDRRTGLVAALMIYTCQAFFLINNDVRADTLLTAFVAFSCWQLIEFAEGKSRIHFMLGFTGVALAMMAKGPIGAVVPASALFVHFVLKRRWGLFFRWEWLAGIVWTLILLLPMLVGLQKQFGSAGPVFFFWTQSFGRITGENVWQNNTGYFYFTHALLWSFLPWSVPVAAAVIVAVIKIFRTRFAMDALPEYYSVGGFVLPFIALSFSHYKLPHYIFVLYPLGALLTAHFLFRVGDKLPGTTRVFSIIQLVVPAGMLGLAIYICTVWFPTQRIVLWLFVLAGILAFMIVWWKRGKNVVGMVQASAFAAITVNLLLNAQAYPALLRYQSGSEIGLLLQREQVPVSQVYSYGYSNYALDFYLGAYPDPISMKRLNAEVAGAKHFWVMGNEDLKKQVDDGHLPVKRMITFNSYHVTTLTTRFLNRSTRPQTLNQVYLFEF